MAGDVITAVLILSGSLFAFVAALGMLRMPDMILRMHASTKAGTLGAGLILGALAAEAGAVDVVLRAVATIVFLLLTAPVAAHVIARAAYRRGLPLWNRTCMDESSDYAGHRTPCTASVRQDPSDGGEGSP